MLRVATNIGRDHLGSMGVCFGKFTKTGKFRLHITALDHLAQYAKVSALFYSRRKRRNCLEERAEGRKLL